MTGTEATTPTIADADADTGLDTDLDHEFEQRGLSLLASAESPDLAGPFSVVSFAPADAQDAPPQIAVAIVSSDDLEPFDQAVAGITATHPELAPSTAVSMATIAELAGVLPEPIAFSIVLYDAEPIGLVARHANRRKAQESAGSPATSTEDVGTGVGNPGGDSPGDLGAGATPVAEPAAVAQQAPSAAPAGMGAITPMPTNPIIPLDGGFGLLQDVVLEVSVELGRSTMPLARLMNLGIGSIVELDRAAGAPVDVRVNGTLFAHGEVVVVDDEYAVRILEILAPTK